MTRKTEQMREIAEKIEKKEDRLAKLKDQAKGVKDDIEELTLSLRAWAREDDNQTDLHDQLEEDGEG